MQITGGMRREGVAYLKGPGAGLLLLGGVLCILVGYWAPWVDDPAAGLVQNGFELSEFVKLLPQVRNSREPVFRWLFFLPLPTVALGLSLWATRESRHCLSGCAARWLGMAPVAVSLLLLMILIPPYPYTIGRLLGDEFRTRTILALLSWAAFPLTLLRRTRWLARRRVLVLLAFLMIIGTASSIVQFLCLRDALNAVYGRPTLIGWGVWLMSAGMLAILGGTALGFRQAKGKANR